MNELVVDLGVRVEAGVAIVNSRDVARVFDKRHDHVLRDIDDTMQKISPDLGRSWFRPAVFLDSYGREQPSVDLTRDGFTLLTMGYTGEGPMAFKVAYIQAFNEMERRLRENDVSAHSLIISAVRELVSPLAVRFECQDVTIARVERRVDGIAEDVAHIKRLCVGGRKRLSPATKREHIDAIHKLGGRCPCCGIAEVVDAQGNRLPFSEFDHFFVNTNPSPDATWLICKPCNNGLMAGRMARDQVLPMFHAYQQRRRQLPGRMPHIPHLF